MPDKTPDLNDHPVRANRGIVSVVVVLGVLIVIGLGGLVYGIAQKAGKLGQSETAEIAPVSNPVYDAGQGRLVGMTADAGILYLHIRLGDGRDIIKAYNPDGGLIYQVSPLSNEEN